MSGILYLVGTPIGNLGDFSPRAQRVLEEADFIAAEDTRVSMKLLNHFGIKKPLVSYYEHNRAQSGERILSRLLAGESCALVTDAGMPAISDPGEDLVRLCAQSGVEIVVVPGPSAVVSALALSALSTQRFCFEGFLSTAKRSRFEHLDSLRSEKRTMVFYEAPHKLLRTLEDMAEYFGGDRQISLCREITKLHEETLRTTLSGAVEHFTAQPPKGEFVLVLAGAPEEEEAAMTIEQALELVSRYRGAGDSLKVACKKAAADSGFGKNELYELALGK
ncbi:MAG: 16S rRNA (cytidine(1402)-2'-O)-methyltransferase [Candidatus Heteroscillospira sp.]|jgi:16S rRNA (cytidine1402-2'-O)-methyltransferase